MDQLTSLRGNISHTSNSSINIVSTTSDLTDLTDLPIDVFLLIISHLSPRESVLCRGVSRAWNVAFTSNDVSWNLMIWHFPRVREMRNAVGAPGRPAWGHIFPKVAHRYFHLASARPRLIEKIHHVQEEELKPIRCLRPGLRRGVDTWNRWLQWNHNTAKFQYNDPAWCLEDGLLIYQEPVSSGYVAYDLETKLRFPIPFDGVGKTVRRQRLAHGILVIEWCEREPYLLCSDRAAGPVRRHFATAFDVQRSTGSSSSDSPCPWEIRLRSEWKIHSYGLSLHPRDRFFSAHTATHYAVYIWQPNRSPRGGDPLEQLIVWDITDTSSYRPSEDPTGAKILDTAQLGPRMIKTFTSQDLDFLGIRQRQAPALREILLDEANVYLHEENHRWEVSPLPPPRSPRHHHVRCTGIPLSGVGPRWLDECCADGDVHLSFCPRAGSAARVGNDNGNGGPDHFDGTWPGWAPCWRHEEFPYLTVSDVVDAGAGVRIVARQCFVMEALSSFVLPKISLKADLDEVAEVHFPDDLWKQLLGSGKIAGDERWVVGDDAEGTITIVRF
ncbi:hypothetical protein HD806DRAFT_529623 [Xylariaceae sp. AK1471]|nr:hypothetical protein HD806DRAFT_529623 [Xylariaceae sp. AK1471]